MSPVRTCLFCDADLEYEAAAGWVDAMSGDDGGTYDYCPVNSNNTHVPAAPSASAGKRTRE